MKYTNEMLKQYGLDYNIIYDEKTFEPLIMIYYSKNENLQNYDNFFKYKTTITEIIYGNAIDDAIDNFIAKSKNDVLDEIYR